MPHLATSRDPIALSLAVKQHYKRFPFLSAVLIPALDGRSDKLALYGSETSCTDALIEATTNHPGCERYGEWEYLPPHRLAELRAQQKADPMASTLQNLGLVKPDGSPLT
jgi:hypothetical protein